MSLASLLPLRQISSLGPCAMAVAGRFSSKAEAPSNRSRFLAGRSGRHLSSSQTYNSSFCLATCNPSEYIHIGNLRHGLTSFAQNMCDESGEPAACAADLFPRPLCGGHRHCQGFDRAGSPWQVCFAIREKRLRFAPEKKVDASRPHKHVQVCQVPCPKMQRTKPLGALGSGVAVSYGNRSWVLISSGSYALMRSHGIIRWTTLRAPSFFVVRVMLTLYPWQQAARRAVRQARP